MKHAAQTRRDLGIRSAFNLLGPLTNPAGAARQIVGVPKPELTELVAKALLLLGSERAWVVHGADGLDELSTTGYTKMSECRDGAVHTFYVHPADFGVPKAAAADLAGGDAAENAGIVRGVLDGRKGPARDVVVFNAGAALLVAGTVASVRDGLRAGGSRHRLGRGARDARPHGAIVAGRGGRVSAPGSAGCHRRRHAARRARRAASASRRPRWPGGPQPRRRAGRCSRRGWRDPTR